MMKLNLALNLALKLDPRLALKKIQVLPGEESDALMRESGTPGEEPNELMRKDIIETFPNTSKKSKPNSDNDDDGLVDYGENDDDFNKKKSLQKETVQMEKRICFFIIKASLESIA